MVILRGIPLCFTLSLSNRNHENKQRFKCTQKKTLVLPCKRNISKIYMPTALFVCGKCFISRWVFSDKGSDRLLHIFAEVQVFTVLEVKCPFHIFVLKSQFHTGHVLCCPNVLLVCKFDVWQRLWKKFFYLSSFVQDSVTLICIYVIWQITNIVLFNCRGNCFFYAQRRSI